MQCGCYAQVGKDKLEEIPEIDLILGTNEKSKMLSYIEEYLKTKNKIEVISDVMKQKDFDEFGEVTYTDKTRAVIKVQDGCDRFCSYCIIPYARGRVRSRKIENVIDEIEHIAAKRNKRSCNYRNSCGFIWKRFKRKYRPNRFIRKNK